jgi:oligopeptidase B
MRDTADPDFLAFLTAGNEHAEGWFAPHAATIEAIFDEIRSRVRETDMSTPVFNGGWWYVSHTTEGKSYPSHHRGPRVDSPDEHVLVDENVEAHGHEYFDLGALDLTADHTMLAWSSDTTGDERYTLRVRDAATGVDGATEIDDVSNAGTAWSADARFLFYVTPDAQERPSRVWRHRIGTAASDDELVFEELDERFFVGVGVTRSMEWIVIHSASKTSAEARLLPTATPTAEPIVVVERRDDVEYSVDHWGDRLLMLTNDEAVDFRILTAPVPGDWTDPSSVSSPSPSAARPSWTELEPHVAGRRIISADPFADHLVVQEWADAQPRLRILFRDGRQRTLDLGDEPHDIDLSANPEWQTDLVRFTTQSLTSPPTVFDEHVVTGERTFLRRVPTPNVDLDQYTSRRIWATSSDGTRVPVDVVHHVDTALDGTAPGVVYGYGAYEISLPPWFSVARLSLLDRGFVWALAHPRGGGELGRAWYLDGKLEAKQHTFDDTIACAEHLGERSIVARRRLAVRGGSAGGLLVGGCVVQHPELVTAAVAEVPFVDIVSTMSDTTLPLTVTEWEEWGDPRTEPYASVMLAYSPYDNTGPSAYPAIYVTAGLTDPRVSVHEPAKWVARLRDMTTGERPIVMRTEMGAGHGGPTGRYDAWRDEARTLAFLLATV